ncbi:hypothetical protein SDC9_204862 [bioreactor metagenome]|uniref:Uncharacterized protein n=1 Tax=bioreactor metagenome TaxID=1076179 RepID=A0A645J0F6_9ZZZZ
MQHRRIIVGGSKHIDVVDHGVVIRLAIEDRDFGAILFFGILDGCRGTRLVELVGHCGNEVSNLHSLGGLLRRSCRFSGGGFGRSSCCGSLFGRRCRLRVLASKHRKNHEHAQNDQNQFLHPVSSS